MQRIRLCLRRPNTASWAGGQLVPSLNRVSVSGSPHSSQKRESRSAPPPAPLLPPTTCIPLGLPTPFEPLLPFWPAPFVGTPPLPRPGGGSFFQRYKATPISEAHFFRASVAAPFRSNPMSSGVPLDRERLTFWLPNCWRVTVRPSIETVSSPSAQHSSASAWMP